MKTIKSNFFWNIFIQYLIESGTWENKYLSGLKCEQVGVFPNHSQNNPSWITLKYKLDVVRILVQLLFKLKIGDVNEG